MSNPFGRIWFPGNPWPNGHALKQPQLFAQFDNCFHEWGSAPGAYLRLQIESENYYAEWSDAEVEAAYKAEEVEIDQGVDRPNWQSYIVWQNYHSCRIGDNAEILIGNDLNKFTADWFEGKSLKFDPVDGVMCAKEHDDLAFHCYILGHDSVADHKISIRNGRTPWTIDMDWRGKVALTYIGDDEFKYDFRAEVRNAPFLGFRGPRETTRTTRRGLLGRKIETERERRETRSLDEREAYMRDLANRFTTIPEDGLVFTVGSVFDWLVLKQHQDNPFIEDPHLI